MASMFSSSVGLATGVEWGAMIDSIIAYESQPLARIQSQIKAANDAKTAWGQLEDLVGKFRKLNEDLRFGRTFGEFTAEVSETSVGIAPFTATTRSDAVAGNYDIEVQSLAKAHVMTSSTFTDSAAGLGFTGDFTVNGVSISVGAGDSLNSIRDQINAADAGVLASVVQLTPGNYSLQIKSEATGASGIDFADGTGAVGAALGIATTQAGADARIVVDGTTYVRTTNKIDDVITGVTLDLKQTSAGETVSLSVGLDTEAVADAMQAYVDAYNAIKNFTTTQSTWAEGTNKRPLYDSKVLLKMGERQMRSAFGSDLWMYGIETDREGRLTFDRSKFIEKYEEDPTAAAAQFATVGEAMDNAILSFTENGDSIADSAKASMDRRIERLNHQVDRWESRMEVRRATLEEQFRRVEQLVSQLNAQMSSLSSIQIPTYYNRK